MVFAVFELIALHVMTRGGRGWLARGFGFSSLIVTSIILDRFSRSGCVSHDHWLLVCFASKIGLITLLVFLLSRDSVGRRLFLAITYSAYSPVSRSSRTCCPFATYSHFRSSGLVSSAF